MTKFNTEYIDHLPDHVSVAIDNRFQVELMRTGEGLRINVFPITDGDVWDDPFERFDVDESEVLALEQEIGHG